MKLRIILKSFNKELINTTIKNLQNFLLTLNKTIFIKTIVSLPIKIKKFCVLRSPHIDKDSREHFEIRLYKKFIDIELVSLKAIDVLFNFKILPGIACLIKEL